MRGKRSRYDRIIDAIFQKHYEPSIREFEFDREEFVEVAERLEISRPKNLGDVLYTYRYRRDLPDSIADLAPHGFQWSIKSVGIGHYRFVLERELIIAPAHNYAQTKILDATPGVIRKYALTDEQALLAILRYNRLIDIFTGLTCYSLQNHLRTTVKGIGQVETDELYIGLDKRGAHYIIPVQAKGGTDKIGSIQIEQDFALCAEKYPVLICKPLAAQFMEDSVIALFEFEDTDEEIRICAERHYRLVAPDQLTSSEVAQYRQR